MNGTIRSRCWSTGRHRWRVDVARAIVAALCIAAAGCTDPIFRLKPDPAFIAPVPGVDAALPPLAAPPPLAVITWNLDAGRGDLPRLISDLTSGRLIGIAPEHTLLLLQEVVGDVDGLHAFVVPVYEVAGRLRGNAIVSTLPLRDTRAIALPQERQPRMAAVATIEVRGERLFAVSAHLENRLGWLRGSVFGDRARARQAEALIRALPDGHGILGGDLNSSLGVNEPALRLLAKRFPDAAITASPTFKQRLALDHLFFDLPDGWRADIRIVANRYGSDHHPVLGLVGSW